MPASITVSVSGIGIRATEDDVKRYFEERLKGCQPVVSPLVKDPLTVTKVTTVTFKRGSRVDCQRAVAKLKAENVVLRDAVGYSSEFGFDDSFLNVTLLAGKSDEPTFDVYFVHGFGGSAFDTFASKSRDHRKIRMWARDFLPYTLDTSNLGDGRYLTFGYPSPFMDRDQIAESIEKTAIDLLRAIVLERGNDCSRPIFFVCHSLGGLVVSEALVLLLREHLQQTQLWDYQKALCPYGDCLVKGITFFGTPFGGSVLANLLAEISILLRLPVNRAHLMSLIVKNQDVAELLGDFRKDIEKTKVPLRIFYELLPEKLGILKRQIVSRDSADAHLGVQVHSKGLLASHRGLVKFKSPQDWMYVKEVAPEIRSMIHDQLRQVKSGRQMPGVQETSWTITIRQENLTPVQLVSLDEPSAIMTKLREPTKGGVDYTDHNLNVDTLPPPYSEVERAWVKQLAADLKFNHDNFQDDRKERIGLIREACTWILEKREYKNFVASTHNAILFIEGGPGFGKSSLAKFLTNPTIPARMTDLDESHQLDPPTIVADYFSKKGGRDNSPKAILMHILYQIRQNSEASFDSAAGQLFSSFTQQRDLEFYWSLFTKIRKSLKANCYYILDGFDECIRQHRSERQSARDDVMVDFLRRLCAISKETLSGDENWTTKILLTTRPEPEVEVALVGQTVLKVPIALSDLSPGVKIVVTKEVATLAENRDVSPEVQEFIVGEVIKRCGSLFQMALTAVQFLQEPYCFDLNDREMVKAALQGLKFDKYNNIYTQVLERIHPQDREMAAKIIRILFFIRLEYPALDILQHALTMDKVDPTAEDLASPTSKGSISNLIRVSLGMLISLQDDETVDLQHPVIFDFLRTLSPTNLKAYSCEDNQEGNLYLSLICIRYLTLWRHQPLSEEEIVAAGGDEEVAAARKSPLLEYACRCWSSHTRDAGKLIKPHMNMVNKFLGITIPELLDPEDLTDYLYMVNNSRITEQSAKKETIETCPPIMFLATQNMEYVLSRYIQLQTKGRWPPAWIPRRQSRAAFGFGLDSQDETGATALHYACRGGFVGVCALLLRAGAQGSLRTVDGYTPFAYAVENGHEYMAELLIQKNQAFDGGDSEKGLSCIHFAAVQGMMGVLKFLLKRGTDPNCRSSVGWTPVHLAAQEGEINCIKLILKAGGRPDSANSIGVTPLHCAALHGRLDVLQLLFHLYPALYPSPRTVAGSDVPGSTPLNSAARLGQLECFKFLSLREHQMIPDEDGYLPIHTASAWGNKSIVNQFHELSQLNAQENNGRQPLHLAALNGHPGIFAYLKNQGAEAQPDHNGYLPIHLAAAGGYLSIVKLCPVEDDINAITKQEALPIHLAVLGGNLETFRWLRSHGSKNAPDNTGQLPLHYACSQGHNAIVREYQDSPDIHSATNDGWLPIHLAAFDGHIEAIKALLDLGAQLDAKSENISVGGGGIKAFPTTALGIAAQMEQEDLAIYLIGCGADIKISGPAGQGLVHYAAFNGLNGLFQLLVQMGQDVWLGDEDNDTPLHFAALGGKNEIVQAYIDLTRGSSISLDVGNLLGATPLMLALSAGHLETVELLLSAGATLNQRAQDGTCLSYAMIHPDEEFLRKHFGHGTEVDATDSIEGATALHFAIEQKHLGACKHLISLGANLNIQSKNGLTPLSYAAIKSSSEIVQLLLNSGSDTTLEDIFGRTAFDYAEKNPAIFKLMEPYLNNRPARSTSELNEKAKLCVQKILSSLPDVSPLNPGAEKLQYSSALENLGWGLLLLKDYDNARSCLEIRIFGSPYIERTLDCICSLCEKADEWTSFWMCKQCPSLSGMCPSCYEARSEVKIMSWCSMGHEFMEIGGEEWARLAPGYVNKEGKTIDHFIAELKQKYRVNVDSQDEIQNGTGRGLA